MKQNKAHWEQVFKTKTPEQVSWTESYPKTSVGFIQAFKLKKNTPIIDIGGGDSLLIDALLDLGFTDLSVLDISKKALQRAQKRLGSRSDEVNWIASDIIEFEPKRKYGLWHDRACFHFLTKNEEIDKYKSIIKQSKSEYFVLGTFSTSGPEKCSGLMIKQYDCERLETCFNDYFDLQECAEVAHTTPFDTIQKFVFSRFKRRF